MIDITKYLILLCMLTWSCHNKNSDMNIVVDRLSRYSYDAMVDKSIYLYGRGDGSDEGVFYLSKLSVPCSPYIIHYDYLKQTIISHDNKLVLKSCKNDYLSINEINDVVSLFVNLDVRFVKVDLDTNVFVNPSLLEKPNLVKMKMPSQSTNHKNIKGDWYVLQ